MSSVYSCIKLDGFFMKKLCFLTYPLLILMVSLTSSELTAQPALIWSKCYGNSIDQVLANIAEAWGGGYVMSGTSDSCSYGNADFYIMKIDDTGKQLWTKCYGGTGGDWVAKIVRIQGQAPATDGYVLIGTTNSNDGDVTGLHGSTDDYWVVKLDINGNIQWQKTYGGSGGDAANDAAQVMDGGIVIVGSTYSNDGDVSGFHGGYDLWIVKLSQSGSIIWKKTLGGSFDELHPYVTATSDGGVAIAGSSGSMDGDVTNPIGSEDIWVVKLDSLGAMQWNKSYGSFGYDVAISIMQTSDNGYLVSGQTTAFPATGLNHGLIKLNDTGAIQWTAPHNEVADIIEVGSKQYIISGRDLSVSIRRGFVRRIDSVGNTIWNKAVGGSSVDWLKSIYLTSDGGYIIGGDTKSTDGDVSSNHGGWDYWVVRLAGQVGISEIADIHSPISIYPNPATDKIIFSEEVNVRLINMLGQAYASAEGTRSLDIAPISPGVYFVILYDKKGQLLKKATVVKQ
jgi:hypothetical protein